MTRFPSLRAALLLTVVFFLGLPLSAAAQDPGDISVEIGATALVDAGQIGITAGASYGINEMISAVAAFTFLFCDDLNGRSRTCYGFDVNGRYLFSEMFYAVGGINWTRVSVDVAGSGGTNSNFGLNVGAGANLGFLFAEARFALGGWDDLVPVVGFRVPVGRN